MTIVSLLKTRLAALAVAAVMTAGLGIGQVEAMPVAPATTMAPSDLASPAAYHLHRRYPGYHSRSARAFRHARRFSPNRYCHQQPSRCH